MEIIDRMPTVEEHHDLFEAQGWSWYGDETVRRSLDGSLHGVVGVRDGLTVGMGRVLGDGGAFHYVQDLVVVPELRGGGVGTALLQHLLDQIRRSVPGDSVVGLFSTPEAIPLYRKFGFGEPELTGMMAMVGRRG